MSNKKSFLDRIAPMKAYRVKIHVKSILTGKTIWSADVPVKARSKGNAKKMLPKLFYLDAKTSEMEEIKPSKPGRISSKRN